MNYDVEILDDVFFFFFLEFDCVADRLTSDRSWC